MGSQINASTLNKCWDVYLKLDLVDLNQENVIHVGAMLVFVTGA